MAEITEMEPSTGLENGSSTTLSVKDTSSFGTSYLADYGSTEWVSTVPYENDGSDDNSADSKTYETTAAETETTDGTFEVDAPASGYAYGATEDGDGFVIWDIDGNHDLLNGVTTIRFTDIDISLTPANDEYHDVQDVTQHLHGNSDADVFVVDGLSTDYGYDATEDGEGIVVWDMHGNHNLLYGFETIRFSDTDVDLAEQPSSEDGPDAGDGSDPLPEADGDIVQDEPGTTQYLMGSPDAIDRFVIDGPSSSYGWDNTDDGGWVVWHLTELTHDIFYEFDQIGFSDMVADLASGSSYDGDPYDGSDVDVDTDPAPDADGIVTYDDPETTQYLMGSTDAIDRFVIDAESSAYGYDETDDGGWVVWDETELTHDLMYEYDQIEFIDTIADLG